MDNSSVRLKILARSIMYDETTDRILLVKNKHADFWYAPGGGWEYERETIQECAKREVYEETGLYVDIQRLLYVQEFHEAHNSIFFETFWLAKLAHQQELNAAHSDLDPQGSVEQAKWFTKDELNLLKVFPKRLKNTFWDDIKKYSTDDPFIGVS